MASDEFLSRIDEHMARGNEHMARGNELMEQIRTQMEQVRAEIELNRQAYEDGLRITREMNRRNEITIRESSTLSSELIDAVREIGVGLREVQQEARAQTRAIFQVLDRLDGPQPAGA